MVAIDRTDDKTDLRPADFGNGSGELYSIRTRCDLRVPSLAVTGEILRAAKMVADKGKKSKVEEEASDPIDGELVLSIEKLQEIQDEIEKVNEEASDKVLEVEQKYNEIRRPIYKRRNEIIQSIPDFWLTAIFKYLVSLDVEDSKDVKSGYSVTFVSYLFSLLSCMFYA
ncbi:hypothetical protein B296_00039069 [Ensete ventricosum]|uniref:Uncharacterized protein n=1 Tax=Ensete ventricosum TaxID=4639 RepID=A0A426ZK30_ENSVE|nr:hypothetical protein B296_00039069 [Ensete ventricosum]